MPTLRLIFLLVLLTMLTRGLWLVMIPMVEAPDEITHMWVIEFLASHLRLPSSAEVISAGPTAVYGSIPQLGYLPHVLLVKLLPNLPALVSARIASLLLGCFTVAISCLVAEEIFVAEPLLAHALPLALVFHPQLVFVESYANSDATTCALASLIVLLLVKSLRSGSNPYSALLIGLLCALVGLSKYSGYAIILTALIFVPVAGFLHRKSPLVCARHLILVLLPIVAIDGAWFYRNYVEFNGDVTGARTLYKTWAEAYHRKFANYQSPWAIATQNRFWRMNFFSFWGWFGYMTRSLPRAVYYGYLAFLLSAVAGGIQIMRLYFALPKAVPNDQNDYAFDQSKLLRVRHNAQVAVWSAFLFCSLVNILASIFGASTGVSGPQGRYFFTSEIPLMALLLAGLYNLSRRFGKSLVIGFVFFNLAIYLYSTQFLYSLYGFSMLTHSP